MGKYTSRVQKKEIPKDEGQGCLWRGIGCTLMVVVPAISFALAILTVNSEIASDFLPPQLMGYPVLPDVFYNSSGLIAVFSPLTEIESLYAILVVGALYTILLGGIISLIYATIYRILNPKRYGPTDAPPPKFKAKAYKR
jgi:hypothetical protein